MGSLKTALRERDWAQVASPLLNVVSQVSACIATIATLAKAA